MEHLVKKTKRKRQRRARAHLRVRRKVRGSQARPRLAVFKSLRYVYAQLIDDDQGVTLISAELAGGGPPRQAGQVHRHQGGGPPGGGDPR